VDPDKSMPEALISNFPTFHRVIYGSRSALCLVCFCFNSGQCAAETNVGKVPTADVDACPDFQSSLKADIGAGSLARIDLGINGRHLIDSLPYA
jgi:hypothetical protein